MPIPSSRTERVRYCVMSRHCTSVKTRCEYVRHEPATYVLSDEFEHTILGQDTDHHLSVRLWVPVDQWQTAGMCAYQESARII